MSETKSYYLSKEIAKILHGFAREDDVSDSALLQKILEDYRDRRLEKELIKMGINSGKGKKK